MQLTDKGPGLQLLRDTLILPRELRSVGRNVYFIRSDDKLMARFQLRRSASIGLSIAASAIKDARDVSFHSNRHAKSAARFTARASVSKVFIPVNYSPLSRFGNHSRRDGSFPPSNNSIHRQRTTAAEKVRRGCDGTH